jgi:hypothetical protein
VNDDVQIVVAGIVAAIAIRIEFNTIKPFNPTPRVMPREAGPALLLKRF